MSKKTLHAPAVQGGKPGQVGPFQFDGIWFTGDADYNAQKAEAKWPTVAGVPPGANEPATQAAPHSVGN